MAKTLTSFEYVLPLADPKATLKKVGGKGASLARLYQAGFPVPDGFHVTTAAYRRFVAENNLQPGILAALEQVDLNQPATLEAASTTIHNLFASAQTPPEVAGAIATAYAELAGRDPFVAVRSSATAEDLPEASFAGQQDTFLNLQGVAEVLEAVKRCWASLWTARAIGYRERNHIEHAAVSLAVVVQLLVPSEAAGILFTANPLNGRRDQALINAAWGLGEAVVGGIVTPDTLTMDKGSLQLIASEIANKQVMTVRVNGGTQEQPVPEELRRAPALGDEAAAELTQIAVQIEQLYDMPMDIEWALSDGKVYIVQARPITALPPEEQIPEAIDEWNLPNPKARYMRNNIVELMPDPLSPLFETLGLRIVNASMNRIMADFFGQAQLTPENIVVTINRYAYYNGELTPKQILGILWNSVGITRRMFRGIDERWQAARVRYAAVLVDWQNEPWRQASSNEILEAFSEVMGAAIEYYMAILSGLIPAAWISEAAFTKVYNRLIKRVEDPTAATFLLGFDSLPIRGEKTLYDLASWAKERNNLSAYLADTPTRQLVARLERDPAPPGLDFADWHEWCFRFQGYLNEFGGTIYDLDFAKQTPNDDPTPLLETFKLFLQGGAVSPYSRQRSAAERREGAIQSLRDRLKGWRVSLFNYLLARAQKYAPWREDGLAEIGMGYPLLRQMLLEIGQRLSAAGYLEDPDDIFWLEESDLRQAIETLDRGEKVAEKSDEVHRRKADWNAARLLTPPMVLPQRTKFLGIELAKLGPARIDEGTGDVIQGTACSPGEVTATARVLHGPQDFDQFKPGEVLVAAITTPAWTPLFVMASAVVTDVGGPLSHGSIVAREYTIPAVLGTGVATRRIRSGQSITVNGSEGKVYLKSPTSPFISGLDPEWRMPDPKGPYMRGSIADFMPDPLTPLFLTTGVPAIASAMRRIMVELIGSQTSALDNYLTTINDYAYLYVNLGLQGWLWVLFRMGPAIPRLLRDGERHWREVARPRYAEAVTRWRDRNPGNLTAAELLGGAEELTAAMAEYLTTLQVDALGTSAGTEGLFTAVYDRFVRREGDPPAATLLLGADNLPIRSEKELYDLAKWIRERGELTAYLLETPSDQIAAQLADDEAFLDDRREWQRRFRDYLSRYGHSIYDLDFAKPLPADEPLPLLETLKMFVLGEGTNPHERQQKLVEQREAAVQTALGRVKGLKLRLFRWTLRWAQTFAVVREDSIFDIGLSYPALRRMLRELGRRFAEAGAIPKADDIFWLERDEVERGAAALDRGEAPENLASQIEERKVDWQAKNRMTPPQQLPPKVRVMGIKTDTFMAVSAEDQTGDALKGVPASPGKVTATARVLLGPEDFDQMQPGDILVAEITTPAWTPLFAMAAGVVTDIGGPLSHGSIVAREYGIPAVLGTGVATQRILSGQTVTVDGDAGLVRLSLEA